MYVRTREAVVIADRDGPVVSASSPELVVFSLGQEVAHATFWHVCHELEVGRRFPIGEPTEETFQNCSAVLVPVSLQHYRPYLGWR